MNLELSSFETQLDSVSSLSDDARLVPSSVDVSWIDRTQIDDHFLSAWRELARFSSEPNIFYEKSFLSAALDALSSAASVTVFSMWGGERDDRQLLGIWPLLRNTRFGRWPVSHVQNWRHHNCFLGTPLVRRGFEAEFWEHLFAGLDGYDCLPADLQNTNFLHIDSIAIGGHLHSALIAHCKSASRRCDIVSQQDRAMLQTDLPSAEYYEQTVRKKKRKELSRLRNRLDEQGKVSFHQTRSENELDCWIDEFLELENSGWKGKEGSALASSPETKILFERALHQTQKEGALERLELRLNGHSIAMLVNFWSGTHGFSFKTAFDEQYAQYSPGVLLQLENLKLLDEDSVSWVDSCAAEGHPMIDRLWSSRRTIGRVSVALSGEKRSAVFRLMRFGEDMMARIRGRALPMSIEMYEAQSEENEPSHG